MKKLLLLLSLLASPAWGATPYATLNDVISTSGALKSNGSGSVSQAACADLSNAGTACTATAPANTTATTHQFFDAYTASTGAFTKAQPACGDLSNAATSCSTDATNFANDSGTISSGTWNGSVIGSSYGGAGSVTGALKGNGSGTVSQAACSDLSNGATGCSTATGTSGATIALNNGSNTFSGANTQSGAYKVTATSLPTQAAGTLGIGGEATKPTLAANGEADLYITSTTGGITLIGKGSTNDFTLFNSGGTSACVMATGTTTLNCGGLDVGGTAVSTQTFGTLTNNDWCTSNGTSISCNTASPAVTWPTSGDVVISSGGNSPTGVAEVDGDCLVGTSGSWAAGSCSTGTGTVTSVATNNGLTGGPITTTGTLGLASVSNNNVLCNNSGSSAVPTAANCTVTGTGNAVLATGPTLTGTTTLNGTGLYAEAGYVEEAVYSNGNSGTSFAYNPDHGPTQSLTITGAVTITLTTPTHPGKSTLIIKQDATGHTYSISGCKWPGGTAITYSTAANKIDIISFIYDGSSWYCMGGAGFS